jgi:hypothetical protein
MTPRKTITLKTGERLAKARVEIERIASCVCPYCGGLCDLPTGTPFISEDEEIASWGDSSKDADDILVCLECHTRLAWPASPFKPASYQPIHA